MIFETSVQAQFLIPMAIALGFRILFSTFVMLLVVPAFYVAFDDVRRGFEDTLGLWPRSVER